MGLRRRNCLKQLILKAFYSLGILIITFLVMEGWQSSLKKQVSLPAAKQTVFSDGIIQVDCLPYPGDSSYGDIIVSYLDKQGNNRAKRFEFSRYLGLKDLNHDGQREILGQEEVWFDLAGLSRNKLPHWNNIYSFDRKTASLKNCSRFYPDYYRKHYIAHLKKEILQGNHNADYVHSRYTMVFLAEQVLQGKLEPEDVVGAAARLTKKMKRAAKLIIEANSLANDPVYFDRVTALYSQSKAAYSYYPDSYVGQAMVYLMDQNFSQALKEAQQGVDLEKKGFSPVYFKPGISYYLLGDIYSNIANYEKASAAYKELIKRRPRTAGGYLGLGNVCFALGKYQEALLQYEQAEKFISAGNYGWGDTLEEISRKKMNTYQMLRRQQISHSQHSKNEKDR